VGLAGLGDAEAAEDFDQRVAAERDEAPEHQRVREARHRPLADRPRLQQDVEHEAPQAPPEVLQRQLPRRGGDKADARGKLRREGAHERDEKDPEGERLHAGPVYDGGVLRASIMAGTMSKRSPTMP